MLIWICGLSAAGKTMIGQALYKRMRPHFPRLLLLDSDGIREIFDEKIGHDLKSRAQHSLRIARICAMLDRQGLDVICCAVTVSPAAQDYGRKQIEKYYEVYLDVSLDVVKQRDPKGLYAKAIAGEIHNLAGFDIPYEPPRAPHVLIHNDKSRNDVSPVVDEILEQVPELRHLLTKAVP